MKAEQRHELEKNELAAKLSTAWTGLSSNDPKSNRAWTIALVVLLAVVGWTLWSRYSRNVDAASWHKLEYASSLERLGEVAKDSPNSVQGRIAKFHMARWQSQEALGKLDANLPDERVMAADQLEKVRSIYAELSQASGMPDVLIQEAMLQLARTEETLASVPKANDPAMRGSLDEALKRYEAVVAKSPKSYAGQQASKRLADLKANRADVEKLYSDLSREHAKNPAPTPSASTLPAP